jgi:hypothetical protein
MSKAKTTNAKPSKENKNNAGAPGDVGNGAGINSMDSNNGDANGEQPVKETHSKETHEAMKHYVKAYPGAKHFLISSDGQVFLPANELDAKAHQTKLDAKKGLVKYSL